MNKESLKNILIRHEGLKLKPYKDTVGKLTIGVGRCLDTTGISPIEANMLLDNDIERVCEECQKAFPWFEALCDTRKMVIASMAFNLGLEGLQAFTKMFKAIEAKDYDAASNQMLSSKWAGQVGSRAVELAEMMRDGDTIH